MAQRQILFALGAISLAFSGAGLSASNSGSGSDGDAEERTARIIERAERDAARAAERAEEQAARFAEDRSRIAERAMEDEAKAVEDLAKLEADITEEQAKAREDAAKDQDDLAEDLAEAAEDAQEDEDRSGHDSGGSEDRLGSSAALHDLAIDERADHDERGFPVRRGEIGVVDLAPETLAKAQAQGFSLLERRPLPNLGTELVRLQIPPGLSTIDARERMRLIDDRAVVDLVHYYGLNVASEGKPRLVDTAMGKPRKGPKLVVGVIDTAISPHKGLNQGRIVSWGKGELRDAPSAHGTAVASIIATQGPTTFYSANIFRGPAARPYTSADVIAGALEWMLGHDVPTINMSLAGPRSAILDRLIGLALARGRTIVAAAGNGGPTAPPAYPAAVPGVVAVTAVDKEMAVYRYANRGRYITVAARGVDIVAAYDAERYALYTGTSFAAPYISGWLARCHAGGEASQACRSQLRKAAKDLGAKGHDEIFGYGFVE